VDLALRNPTDNQLVRTDPVTLGWLLQRIGITLPPPGRFGLAPDNDPGLPGCSSPGSRAGERRGDGSLY
jgi:hypothetical protein